MASRRLFVLTLWLYLAVALHGPSRAAGNDSTGIASLSYIDDRGAAWTLEDLLYGNAGEFLPLSDTKVHLGFTKSPHWFKIVLDGRAGAGARVLELSNPRLGEVALYVPDGNGGYRESVAGVRAPFWERAIPSLAPAFPITLQADQDLTVYVRVRNAGSLRFELRLWPVVDYHRHASYALAMAITVGAGLLLLAAHKSFTYLHLRQPGYLWIALFLLACSVRQMTDSAVANMFLWPDAPLWARHAMTFTSLATMVLGIFMANNLLRIPVDAPRWARFNVGIALLAVAGSLLSLSGTPASLYLMLAGGLAIPFSVTLYAILAVQNGSRSAAWFLTSWGMVLAGALVTNLVGPGYLPSNLFTENLLDIALLCAGLSWSLTLTYQLKVHQQEQREMLEAQVRERTSALESALDAVRTLRGLVPICSCCKKIRNDDGFWEHLESYLRSHTEADFSHGLCPDCAEANYPDYFRGGKRDPRGGST